MPGQEGQNKDAFRAYRNFGIGCILVVSSTFNMSFNIYAVDLKKTFGYTQTELEFVAAAGMVGLSFVIPCSLLMKYLGFNKTMAITFVMTEVGMIGMGICAKLPTVFSSQLAIFSLLQFLASNGNAYFFLITLEMTVTTCPLRHAGKLIGVLGGFCRIGSVAYVGIYSTFFATSGDVGGLFFTAAGMVGVCLIAYIVLNNVAPAQRILYDDIEIEILPNSASQENLTSTNHAETLKEESSIKSEMSQDRMEFQNKQLKKMDAGNDIYSSPTSVWTLPTLLRNHLFHMIACPSALVLSVGLVYMNNISSVLESLRISGSRDPFIIALTLGNSFSRFAMGAIFDYLREYKKRVFLFMFCASLYPVAIVIIFINMNSYAAIMTATVISGLGIGFLVTMVLAFLTNMFGKQNNILVHGSFLTLACFVQLGVHLLVGHFYDIARDFPGLVSGNEEFPDCYNNYCFLWSFVFLFIISSVSLGLFVVLYMIHDRLSS